MTSLPQCYDVLIIGGGQAGLTMGYYCQQHALNFIILDAAPETGHAWRTRWDSLRLFTPAEYSSLPAYPFPLPKGTRPTKDQAADYLAFYADYFQLPIAYNQRVMALSKHDGRFVIQTSDQTYHADQVVIATGAHQKPVVPAFATHLSSEVFQIHSSAYRNPQQIPEGRVLVVGGGNSGAQIAAELSESRPVFLSRRTVYPYVPDFFVRSWGYALVQASGFLDVPISSWLGRQMAGSDAVYGVNLKALSQSGRLTLLGEARSAQDKSITFADETILPFEAILWATGFSSEFSWVHLPILDLRGQTCHRRGVTQIDGVYLLGSEWLWTRGSALMGWVYRDARYLMQHMIHFRKERQKKKG